MKRFLFAIVEGGGNVPVQLGVVRRLVARGHEVRVLTDDVLEPEVRAAGGLFRRWKRAPQQNMRSPTADRVRDWEASSPIQALRRLGDQLFFGPAPQYAEDTLEEIAAARPDAMGIDMLVYGAMVAAEKTRVPGTVLMHSTCLLDLPGLPPYGLGLRPGGALARARDWLLKRVVHGMFDGVGLGRLNALRQAQGLPVLRHALDQMTQLDRVLCFTSPAFDFEPRTVPEKLRYVGPVLDDPTWVEPWSSPFSDGDDRPLVLVGLGSTFQNQKGTLERLTAALGELPVRGLVTLGGVFEPSELPAPANVRVVRSAPHAQVLPKARVVVAHGGHGTVMKSLAAGLPILAVPLGRDQVDNATRIVVRGVGLKASPKASAPTYRRALQRLLDEPRFTDAARRLGESIRRDAADPTALEELETLAGQGPDRNRAMSSATSGVTEWATPG